MKFLDKFIQNYEPYLLSVGIKPLHHVGTDNFGNIWYSFSPENSDRSIHFKFKYKTYPPNDTKYEIEVTCVGEPNDRYKTRVETLKLFEADNFDDAWNKLINFLEKD